MSQYKVGYIRVSTQEQGATGLGLEAQRAAIRAYCNGEPDAWFEDVDSGSNDSRKQYKLAVAEAGMRNGELIVAKRDRASRNSEELRRLRFHPRLTFTALDTPNIPGAAGVISGAIFDALPETEKRMIGERTAAAAAARKAVNTKRKKGIKMGNPNGVAAITPAAARAGRAASAFKRIAKARKIAEVFAPKLGVGGKLAGMSHRQAARWLTEHKCTTPKGHTNWEPTQVARIRAKLGV